MKFDQRAVSNKLILGFPHQSKHNKKIRSWKMSDNYYRVGGKEYACPVCRNANHVSCNFLASSCDNNIYYDCENCDRFDLDNISYNWLNAKKELNADLHKITECGRVRISRGLKEFHEARQAIPYLTKKWLKRLVC